MRRRVARFIPGTVMAAAFASACGDGSTATQAVVSLEVSAPGLFVAVGDSMRLAVQARDASGASIPASGVAWNSLDSHLATVDNRGMAYGVMQGVARITASAGAVRDTFRLSVGGVMSFNVSTMSGAAFCSMSSADMREAELRAVSERAIIYEDTSNPSGGFTSAQYQSIAATFDTLVHPVLTEAFGSPSDIDRNGRVVILYTGAVNKLTPSGSNSHVAGFHFARDLLPKAPAGGVPGCESSNAAEIFFMMAPDPQGVLGNVRTRDFVRERTLATIGHEYQHLINAARRLYELGASELEAVWLNEGMSHIAEELLFYRSGGLSPMQRLGVGELTSSGRRASAFNEYAASNYGRLGSYTAQPDEAGPYNSTDNLAGRGAAWSFLRYAADRSARADLSIWKAMASSSQVGFPNLDAAMGAATRRWVADWAVANVADRYSVSMASDAFMHHSWRHHRILGELGRPTLRVRALNGSAVISRAVVAGGSVHVAFRIGASGGGVFPRLAGASASSCSAGSGRTLGVGEVLQGTLAELSAVCFAPAAGGQNLVLTATHLSSTSGATVSFQISGTGLQDPTFALQAPVPDGILFQMAPMQQTEGGDTQSGFDLDLREREKRDLDRLLGRGSPGGAGGPSLQTSGVAGDVIVSVVRVP